MSTIGTSIIIGCLCLVSFVVAKQLNLYTEHFPPYSYWQASSITGLNTELVRRSCEMAGLSCQFQLYPWQRALT
ncbi:hypothetical protein [Rheinheimera baltica]|uniref:hypothetical protein n=1 Tax=Rheinheimera baltica TaxID=67576 RepID=UPI00273F70F5|nr:hypothetical protein [Rheinheimera baltica]MDP5151019.1 hypothetical protein [Rheinheimera baltica]